MKSTDALDAIWEAGLGEFEADARDGAAERVEGVVRRRRVQRNRARAVSAVAAIAVVAALAMLAHDNSGGRVGVSSPDTSSSTTVARTGSRRVTTPSVSVPAVVEIGDSGGKSPSAPSRAGTQPVTSGHPPVVGTGGGGGTPPAPPSDPVPPNPPHGGPPTKPIPNNEIMYVIDDNGLHSSRTAHEAGSVTVKFVDQRSDRSTPVALRSDPQGVFVDPGTTSAFDLRELRAFDMYAAHGSSRVSNILPLEIVEPTLAAPKEPGNQLTVEISGGQIVLPYREVRFGEPIPRAGARSIIAHHWTEIGPPTVTLRVRNLDGRAGNLRVEHGEVMHLSAQDPDQTMTIRLGTPSRAYSLRVQGDGPLLEFVLWRSGARRRETRTMTATTAFGPCISADSHVTEPPGTYIDRIDPAYRDRAPRLHHHDTLGDVMLIDNGKSLVPFWLVAAAGRPTEEVRLDSGKRWEDLWPGGWDPVARLADQDTDGVVAEVIYPSVGMLLCNLRDVDYQRACFQAYNLWMAEFSATAPERLIGIGQTVLRTPEEGIKDIEEMKALGLRGVMLPGVPPAEDYDHPMYDELWDAIVDLEMPPSFHILTSRSDTPGADHVRGPKLNSFMSITRANQDIIGTMIFGAVFERHPDLRVVCVEADAGWAPHWMYRADHGYDRHRNWLTAGELTRRPSEWFAGNVYLTFQDDWVAFRTAHLMNVDRLMWANDFPHSDATWPNSQALLAEHAVHLDERARRRVLHDNVAELYNLTV